MSISQNLNSIFINPVCLEDVIMQINCLNSNKCDDTYNIPVTIIKLCKEIDCSNTCRTLFNGCILKRIYPTISKTAKVISIYKDGDKSCSLNYSPISLLPHFSKIFEKILQIDLSF